MGKMKAKEKSHFKLSRIQSEIVKNLSKKKSNTDRKQHLAGEW